MYTNDAELAEVSVDGQTVVIPTALGWARLQAEPALDGLPLGSPDIMRSVKSLLNFVRRYPEFTLALYRPGPGIKAWLPLVLLRAAGAWQRVFVERLTCPACGWTGQTANPLVHELYSGVPDVNAALQATRKYAVLPCPRCGGKLPRHPIWVEPPAEDGTPGKNP